MPRQMQKWHCPIFQKWHEEFVSCTEDERLQSGSSVLTLEHQAQGITVFADPIAFDASYIADRQNGLFVPWPNRSQPLKLVRNLKLSAAQG